MTVPAVGRRWNRLEECEHTSEHVLQIVDYIDQLPLVEGRTWTGDAEYNLVSDSEIHRLWHGEMGMLIHRDNVASNERL